MPGPFIQDTIQAETSLQNGGIEAALRVQNVAYVKQNPGPGEFSSVAAAVASITTASPTNQFVVYVGPGVYIEPQIVMKPYVSIHGLEMQSVSIVASDPTNHLVIGASNATLRFCTLGGVTSAGMAGVYLADSTNFQVRNCTIKGCYHNIFIEGVAATTSFSAFDTLTRDTIGIGVYVKDSGASVFAAFRSHTFASELTSPGIQAARIEGPQATALMIAMAANGNSSVDCLVVQDGANLKVVSGDIQNYSTAIWAKNIGAAPELDILGLNLDNNSVDFNAEHPGTFGVINGTGSDENSTFDPGTVGILAISLQDPDGELITGGVIKARQADNSFVDISTLITETGTMGVDGGGQLTDGGGFSVNVSAGFGYLEVEPEILKRFDWTGTSITVSASSTNYLYFNSSGVLTASPAFPDTHLIILLGRVVTNGTGIEILSNTQIDAEHTSNLYDNFHREALGPIYVTGSLVTENGVRGLNVGSGAYYFSMNKFMPVGGTGITFRQYYRDGSGGWTVSDETVVENASYDDGTGTLAPLTPLFYAKHSLYLIGDGPDEKYFLVLGQAQYLSLAVAEQAPLALPPTYFDDNVVIIASIIVQEGSTNLVPNGEIRDERPVIGFKSSGISAATVHGNLLGLTADDHHHYLLVSGARAMSGNLDMGANSVTNVNLVDGVDVSNHEARHLPNGADPVTTAAASTTSKNTNSVGTANALSRADHGHQLTATSALADHVVQFDGTDWQAVFPEATAPLGKLWNLREDWTTAVTGVLNWGLSTKGGGSTVLLNNSLVSLNHPGIVRLTGGAVSGRYATISLPTQLILGGGPLVYEWMIQVENLSTGTDEFSIRVGLSDTVDSDFTNGVYFEYTRATNVNWLIKTASGGTRTSTATATPVSAGSWIKLSVSVNAAASSVLFLINGILVGSITTNIPSTVLGATAQILMSGTTTTRSLDIDYFNLNQRFTTPR